MGSEIEEPIGFILVYLTLMIILLPDDSNFNIDFFFSDPMLEMVLISLIVLVLVWASYTDLKTKEVPDWLSFGFIGTALVIRTLFSFLQGPEVLISGVLGLAAFFLLACSLYYTHQWGGGDSKLLMGMGAALGIAYPFSYLSFQWLWFLLTLLFVGASYGVIWMIIMAIKKRSIFWKRFHHLVRNYRRMHYSVGVFSILLLAGGSKIPALLPWAVFPVAVFYLLLFVSSVEKSCFLKRVEPQELMEGDWLMEKIAVGKMVIPQKTLLKQEISWLKEWKERGKIKTVLIKEGIPFVPCFLLAYLVLLLFESKIVSYLWELF